jgi:hypothetical protein
VWQSRARGKRPRKRPPPMRQTRAQRRWVCDRAGQERGKGWPAFHACTQQHCKTAACPLFSARKAKLHDVHSVCIPHEQCCPWPLVTRVLQLCLTHAW